jgi:hypothetical protein
VRADFRRLAFTSCFIFATPNCLLFLSAIALQLSSVSNRWASEISGNNMSNPSIATRVIFVERLVLTIAFFLNLFMLHLN